jgi:hypothetical protein
MLPVQGELQFLQQGRLGDDDGGPAAAQGRHEVLAHLLAQPVVVPVEQDGMFAGTALRRHGCPQG